MRVCHHTWNPYLYRVLGFSKDPATTMTIMSKCERRALQLAEGMRKCVDNTSNCCELLSLFRWNADRTMSPNSLPKQRCVLNGHSQILCPVIGCHVTSSTELVDVIVPRPVVAAAAADAVHVFGAAFWVVRVVVTSKIHHRQRGCGWYCRNCGRVRSTT